MWPCPDITIRQSLPTVQPFACPVDRDSAASSHDATHSSRNFLVLPCFSDTWRVVWLTDGKKVNFSVIVSGLDRYSSMALERLSVRINGKRQIVHIYSKIGSSLTWCHYSLLPKIWFRWYGVYLESNFELWSCVRWPPYLMSTLMWYY